MQHTLILPTTTFMNSAVNVSPEVSAEWLISADKLVHPHGAKQSSTTVRPFSLSVNTFLTALTTSYFLADAMAHYHEPECSSTQYFRVMASLDCVRRNNPSSLGWSFRCLWQQSMSSCCTDVPFQLMLTSLELLMSHPRSSNSLKWISTLTFVRLKQTFFACHPH